MSYNKDFTPSKGLMLVGFTASIAFYFMFSYWKGPLIDAHRKRQDIEQTLKNNPSAYVSPDGKIRYGKEVKESQNRSSIIFNSDKSRESVNKMLIQADKRKRDIPNAVLMLKFEEGLNRELGILGFSAYESEIILNEVKKGINSGEKFSLDIAKGIAVQVLSLSSEREKLMDNAITLAMDDTGGAYSIEIWEKCLERRIENFKANECDRNLLADLRKWAHSNAENERITASVREKYSSHERELVERASRECGRDFVSSSKLLSIFLADCE